MAIIQSIVAARLIASFSSRVLNMEPTPCLKRRLVAHDSRLQFGSLNHAPGVAINPQKSIVADANTLISLPLSGA
jgi:hypothetical protein